MLRSSFAALLASVVLAASVVAQAPVGKLQWPTGALVYKVDYTTTQTHSLKGTKSEAKSTVRVTRRWKVGTVDPAGTATLEMSLTSMYQERTTAGGSVWKFDSENPKDSTPEMRAALTKHLNVPLATVQVDAYGRVVSVKDSKSDASAYENELPFLGTLPGAAMKPGLAWERKFQITLAPPLGTGEKYDAVQKFTVKAVKDGLVTVTTTTELKAKPKAAADMVPLWQMLPKGDRVGHDQRQAALGEADGGRGDQGPRRGRLAHPLHQHEDVHVRPDEVILRETPAVTRGRISPVAHFSCDWGDQCLA
jgi:hypothetical protein